MKSVSLLIQDMLRGSQSAFMRVVTWFWKELVRTADRQLGSDIQKGTSGEEVANDAMASFWRYVQAGRIDPKAVPHRANLRRLFRKFTSAKALRARRYYLQQKRSVLLTVRAGDMRGEQDQASLQNVLICGDPFPDEMAMVNDTVEKFYSLLRPLQRSIVELRRDGWKNREIAENLGILERTVERQLSAARSLWLQHMDPEQRKK